MIIIYDNITIHVGINILSRTIMKEITKSAWVAGLTVTVALGAQAEQSADSPQKETEQIIVTGETVGYVAVKSAGLKTDIPLLDTPQTVSVFTKEQLEDQALQDMGDVLRYAPGVSINQGEGHRDQISIRGQNTTADFFLDGMRDDVQYFRPLYNLDRIEIHKGANALIFGRGGGGGTINRVTKTPVAGEQFSTINASGDTFGAYQFTLDSNAAIGDKAAIRLNALAEGLNNHRDEFDGDRYAINPTVAASLSDRTRVQFSYEYVNDDRVVDRGVPSTAGGTVANPAGPLKRFDDTFFGSPNQNETTFEAHVVRGRIFHDFNDNHRVNATLHYADYDKFYQNLFPIGSDVTNGSVSLDGYRDTTVRENFIAQINFLSDIQTGPLGHQLLYGFEYGNQETENARDDAFFAVSADDQITFPFTDPLQIPSFSFPVTNRDRDSEAEFFSVYIQDQISIGEYIQLVGGVRYDRFDIEVRDQIEINDGAADGNDGMLGRVDEEYSPRAGIIVKPRDNVSIYASYSLSFLPRSGDQFLSLSPSTESLSPEEFENIELGAKWDIYPGLSFTTAIFRLERDSGTTVDPNDPGNTILIGSVTEGFEVQLQGQLTSNWQINTGYSYLDAEEDGRVVAGVSNNRMLNGVPEHLFSMWNLYDINPKLGVGLGIIHQSSQFAAIDNTVELPSFTRVDAAIYYEINSRLNAQVNIENLFNTDYFPAAHNNNNISTGEPVNARFSLNYSF